MRKPEASGRRKDLIETAMLEAARVAAALAIRHRYPPYCKVGAGAAVVAVVSRGSDGLALERLPAACSLAY